MAILTGRLYDGDDENNEDDIADQPTEKLPQPLAAQAIAQAQLLLAERTRLDEKQHEEDDESAIRDVQHSCIGAWSLCPICCMDREEKMRSFLMTDGALLLICDYHIEQIKHGNEEALELFANIIHVANLRYSWPPGYLPQEPG